MAQRDLFIERDARELHLELAGVKAGSDFENLHRDRVGARGGGAAVAKHHRDPAAARPPGRERVADDGCIRIADKGNQLRGRFDRQAVGDVGARLEGILDKGFHHGL